MARRTILLWSVALLSIGTVNAQRKTYERQGSPGSMIRESEIDYQLWEGFQLIRKANAGDPAAQHELGIRYLQGKGFEADTVKAAYWLQKSAAQDFDFAHYNLGILALNGWGTPWNPFDAYRHFQRAAAKKMPEAQFVIGLMLTEDLIVERNWTEAYRYVKLAADQNFDPAKKALVEFQRRGIAELIDTSAAGKKKTEGQDKSDPKMKPIFLTFNVDTTTKIDDKTLLNDLVREGSSNLRKVLGVSPESRPDPTKDSTAASLIAEAAKSGSPEAMTLLGRFAEKGLGTKRDLIRAAAYYVRGMRLESPRAMELLGQIIQEPGFPEELEKRAKGHEAEAEYAWAGLVAGRFDQRLSGEQALNLLRDAADQNYVDAIIELGLCYQSGRWTGQDRTKAIELWSKAADMGSNEATIRLAAVKVFSNPDTPLDPGVVRFLDAQAEEGSILAQVAIGYCYEVGRGLGMNKGKAAGMYRNAAQRGSQTAYDALRRMHDEIRPADKEFEILD